MPIDRAWLRTGGAFQGPLARRALAELTPPRTLTQDERIGPYRIVHELSRGGMAVVYLAERADGEFSQRVALKWMTAGAGSDSAEALFRRERDVLASLEHPGIARLIDGGRTDQGELWFAMELVEGEPIDGWCERRGLPTRQRVALVADLCEAVGFAHARLLIHRDIKPANVLVGSDGRTRLLDFGIARLADQNDATESFALTPGFASPEQWAGADVTIASDIYQVGLLLGVLLGVLEPAAAGRHVTNTTPDADDRRQPTAIEAARLQRLPSDLASILRRSTALDPAQRYATVAALADDLHRWLNRLPVVAHRGGALYRLRCRVRRHPAATAAAAVALALGTFLAWQVVQERNYARAEAERASAEAARARGALDFLTELLDWAAPWRHEGRVVSVEDALQQGVQQLEDRLHDQPRLRAELLYLLGQVYSQRRAPQSAIPLLESALAIQEGLADADPFLLGATRTRLGNMLGGMDRTRSMALFARTIDAMQGRTDVESSRLRVASRRFLAGQKFQSDDIAGARATIDAALEDGERFLPPDDNELFHVRKELATYLGASGELEACLQLRRANYAWAQREMGPDDPATSDLALAVAFSLVQLERVDEARPLLEAESARRLRLWGPEHISYAALLFQQTQLEFAAGDVASASLSIDRALQIAESAGPSGQLYFTRLLALKAAIARELGRLDEAERLLRRALEPTLYTGSSARDFGQYRLELARVLREQARFDDIPALLEDAARQAAPLPARHLRHAQVGIERAFLEFRRGRPEKARLLLSAATQVLEEVPPQRGLSAATSAARELAAQLERG